MESKEEVIAQFNEEVNMTAEELEAWLEDPKSEKAGTGVGVESGHKIVEILKENPAEDPEKYDEEDLGHMRKVVGYNKRHLAQEDHLKETKTREELENAKSTISLKNWGHDPLKTLGEEDSDEATANLVSTDPDGGGEESQTQEQGEENAVDEGSEVEGKEEVESKSEDECKEPKKRKLDSGEELEPNEEEAGVEGTASLSCGDDQGVDPHENEGAPEKAEGQNGQDEPPRKKAKNNAA